MQIADLPELSPEIELVLCLARPGGLWLEEAQKLLGRGIQWEHSLHFARRHSLLAFFYPRLADLPPGVAPAGVLAEARELFHLNLLRSTRLGVMLADIQQALADHGIEMLALRGPLLAEMLYQPMPGVRTFSDLDILVHPGDFPEAYRLLIEAGCQPRMSLQSYEQRWIVRGDRDFSFQRDTDILEVHWLVDEPGYCFPLKNGQFWEGKTSHKLLDVEFHTFSLPLFFLNLCLHGARHRWEKLAWAVDLAWFTHSQEGFDWQDFWEWACELGFRRVAAMGMQVAELVGGVQFPPGVRDAFWQESVALSLTRRNLEEILFHGQAPRRSPYARALDDLAYDLQARERLAAKIYMVANRLFTPRQSDWKALRLPEGLYGLYYPLRPLRLLWSALRR